MMRKLSRQVSLKMHIQKIVLAISIACLILLFGGCINQTSVPEDYFYRLPIAHPTAPLENKAINGTLAIAPLQAEGVYRERPLLYVDAKRPLELVQYHYRHWTQVPSQLIQDSMLEYLRETNIADQVIRMRTGKQVEFIIQGRLQKFERVVHGSKTEVVVELELEYRQRLAGGYRSEAKNYKQRIVSDDSTIHDSVQTFGEALKHIYDQMVADVQTMSNNSMVN